MKPPTKFELMRERREHRECVLARSEAGTWQLVRNAEVLAKVNKVEAEVTADWNIDEILEVQQRIDAAHERQLQRRRWWRFFTRRGLA